MHAVSLVGIRRAAGACAVLWAALSSPGFAVSDAEIVDLIAQGQIADARRLYTTLEPDDTDWLFFEGRIAKAEGRIQTAIETFRQVLSRRPSHINAKRELAHSLFISEEDRAASHHFRELLQRDTSEEQRRGYLHFLTQIHQRKPFSLSGHLAVISSSNVNRGSSESTFHPGVPDLPSFDITSQAEPATGLSFGLTGVHRQSRSDERTRTFQWGLSGRKFDTSTHDRATVSTQLRFGRLTPNSQGSAGPFASWTWRADENDSAALGFGADLSRRVAPDTSLFLSGVFEYRRYPYAEGLDGPIASGQAGLSKATPQGTIQVGARVNLSRPETRHQQFDEVAVFARTSRAWTGGLHAGLRVEVGQRRYADDFPLAAAPRRDDFYSVQVSAHHDSVRFGRFLPTATCTVGSTRSNVAFFKHSVNECTLGVMTRF